MFNSSPAMYDVIVIFNSGFEAGMTRKTQTKSS
jgi:hypothetical protein